MLNSEWLDIGISVVLVWFLFALIVSALNEAIVKALALRSKQLWKALSQLLDGSECPTGLLGNLVHLPGWSGRPANPHPGGGAPITQKLYGTQTVQGLEIRTGSAQKTRIDRIPSAVFSHSIMELASAAQGGNPLARVKAYISGLPDVPLKPQLEAVLTAANEDVNKFQAGIERLFDGQMTRVSALYKKQVHIILVVIGLAVAIGGFGMGLRSDAVALVSDLQRNSDFRTVLVGAATDAARTEVTKGCDPNAPAADLANCQLQAVKTLKSLDLSFNDPGPGTKASVIQRLGFLLPWRHWRATLGVLITGIAISFGSSFWYNLLKRLVGLRSTPSAPAA